MSRRTNSAVWQEAYSRWRVAVQKDGQRRYFYSSTPGRTGQREANRKADAWLEDGIGAKVGRVEDVYKIWLEGLKHCSVFRLLPAAAALFTMACKSASVRALTRFLPMIGSTQVRHRLSIGS